MLITLDLETYYDREYSLSKMTTEAYVRDPRFEVIGISIQIDDEPPYWYPQPQVASALKTIDWSKALVVAQNTMFDGAILGWRYGVNPKGWIDIMGMSRALYPHEKSHSLKSQATRMGVGVKGDEVINALGKRYKDFDQEALCRYGEYCNNDVELTYALFQRYVQEFPTKELKLIDLTLRMYIQPSLVLDRLKLLQHLGEVRRTKSSLLEAATVDKANLMSNPKFAQMLIDLNVPPPMKISPTTGKETYAFAKTDEEFQLLADHPDAQVQALVAARLGNKSTIEETRTEALIALAERSPVLPIPLKYYGAHSGRWSGCLVVDTQVTVYDPIRGVVDKRITDVLAEDLVWDGVEFVPHDGVQFSGFQEVISWDGVTGTEGHAVFTDAGEISLRDAMQGGHRIQAGGVPSKDAVDAARIAARFYEE
jgi:hypothetical protein